VTGRTAATEIARVTDAVWWDETRRLAGRADELLTALAAMPEPVKAVAPKPVRRPAVKRLPTAQEKQQARSIALAEEIDWLRSFGWSKERIADRLKISRSCVEKHLGQSRGAA
jgi:hypothetical protein